VLLFFLDLFEFVAVFGRSGQGNKSPTIVMIGIKVECVIIELLSFSFG
jgi:hypothetical protein